MANGNTACTNADPNPTAAIAHAATAGRYANGYAFSAVGFPTDTYAVAYGDPDGAGGGLAVADGDPDSTGRGLAIADGNTCWR